MHSASLFPPVSTVAAAVPNGGLGVLRPSLLLNGIALIQIRATDTFGPPSPAGQVSVVVTRNATVGICTVPFTNLALLGFFAAFVAQLVATSKHFHLYYMLASWVLTGGVLVLAVVEARRLWPALSPRLAAGAAGLACIVLFATTLVEVRREAVAWIAANKVGARLSKAVVAAGPACANVSRMFVRAPENDLNFGGDTTFNTQQIEDPVF